LAEADEIIAACEKQHAKLAVAHRNRYHPALPTIKKLMDAGQFGKLLEMRARGKEDARGGALDLWVLGSHDFNLMHLFAGAPVACAATLLQNGKPATKTDIAEGAEGVGPLLGNELHARYEFENGVTGYFDSITKAWEKGDGFGLQLIFTKGIVNLRIDVDPIAHWIPGNPFRPDSKPRPWLPITSVGIDQPEVIENVGKFVSSHAYAVSDLCRAMVENRQPLCSAYDGRVTVEMISAVFESHRLQGQRIALPLTSRDHPVTRL
jgi:predicted dehydrogenase